ncbi:hypothetical protein B4133_1991 [Bacillus altitudinis]|nr:hypothetical protein B4133_1991 [Bacillus altitudinis]
MNDAKRAATGVDPITGEELTAGQRVAAGGMAAAGYIPIVGWAGRIFKGGKAVYKTTQATSAAVRAVDIYKTSQKSFDALKTSQKGLYGLTATNGFSEAITGRDMFGNKVSKEQQEASMNAALGMLLPFGAKGFHGKIGLSSQSPEGFNRKRALRHAKDLGGIPRSQQPTRQWQVGDNVFKKGQEHRNYEYSSNHTHHGRYYEFDTPKGKRVIVQHTNDGKLHTHAGKPKEGADPFNYDFKKERYSNIYGPNGDHHIYYNE